MRWAGWLRRHRGHLRRGRGRGGRSRESVTVHRRGKQSKTDREACNETASPGVSVAAMSKLGLQRGRGHGMWRVGHAEVVVNGAEALCFRKRKCYLRSPEYRARVVPYHYDAFNTQKDYMHALFRTVVCAISPQPDGQYAEIRVRRLPADRPAPSESRNLQALYALPR